MTSPLRTAASDRRTARESKTEKKLVRKLFMIPESLDETIQDYRFARRCSSEAEALRQLLARGLASEDWKVDGRSD